ncbi:MAG TPA: type II CAAX endopeptidase family protein [Alphaproteobacteria bacterium]|nr:type II CAAX endopeptidase family protein [Alphaproteobacteria bacterium]
MSAPPPRRWAATITGLVIALVVPAIATSFSIIPISENDSSTKALLLNEAAFWTLALIVLAIVRFWERRPLGSIGLERPTRSAILFGAKIVLVLIALALAAGLAVQSTGLPMPEQPAELVISLPVWLQLFVALSAGFTEEVLFRGYAIERMTELTGSRWIGALLPVFLFGAAHASFWGVAHAIVAGFTGLWLSLLYLWRRNLWTNITAHALLDGLVFLVVDAATAAA